MKYINIRYIFYDTVYKGMGFKYERNAQTQLHTVYCNSRVLTFVFFEKLGIVMKDPRSSGGLKLFF